MTAQDRFGDLDEWVPASTHKIILFYQKGYVTKVIQSRWSSLAVWVEMLGCI